MDTVTEYEYGIGGIEDVIKGRSERLIMGKNPESVIAIRNERKVDSLIKTIDLVGIYQRTRLIGEGFEERMVMEELKNEPDAMSKMKNLMYKEFITQQKRLEDRLHPDLIQVAYDKRILTKNLVGIFLNDNLNRIKILPYDELADPYTKDTTLIEIDNIHDAIENERDESEIKQIFTTVINSFRKKLANYGLTREEYAILLLSEFSTDTLEGKRDSLIKDPLMISLFSKVMNFKKRREEK